MNSMTGYGKYKLEKENREYIVEIRSLNHKYSDVTVKVPRNLMFVEDKIRKEIIKKIKRGKIDVFLTYINNGIQGKNVIINKELANIYINQIQEFSNINNIEPGITGMEIVKMPDMLNMTIGEEEENVIESEVLECVRYAVDNLIEMRKAEGNKIKIDIKNRLDNIKRYVEKVFLLSSGLVEEYVVKLNERIKEILKTEIVDEARIAQEVVIYSDRCSIEEELTRLRSHISQFYDLLECESEIGKKLDFLIQEMNRETNTMGSKSGNLEITNIVVNIKTELEDIREQIQNIE